MGLWSDIDLLRQPFLFCQFDHGSRDREVLQAYAGAVENRDLGAVAARIVARDHRAQFADRLLCDQAGCDGVLGLADGDRLRDLIGKDAGAGDQRRVQFLLALGVGAHGRDMGRVSTKLPSRNTV